MLQNDLKPKGYFFLNGCSGKWFLLFVICCMFLKNLLFISITMQRWQNREKTCKKKKPCCCFSSSVFIFASIKKLAKHIRSITSSSSNVLHAGWNVYIYFEIIETIFRQQYCKSNIGRRRRRSFAMNGSAQFKYRSFDNSIYIVDISFL